MNDKLQYDSFYKFLASIGIILIVAPLFALYYIITGAYNIQLSKTEYENLSAMSLHLINIKANCLNKVYSLLPIISFISIFSGLILIYIGCKKWYEIQKSLDETTNIDLQAKKLNIRKMSESEIIEKTIKEEEETHEESTSSPSADRNVTIYYSNIKNNMIKALQIEDACYKYIRKKLNNKYLLHQNVKIENYEYDIIASSIHYNLDMIYEIKYWKGLVSTSTISNLIERIGVKGEVYENNVHRNYKFIIMIVSQKENLELLKTKFDTYIENQNLKYINLEFLDENELT